MRKHAQPPSLLYFSTGRRRPWAVRSVREDPGFTSVSEGEKFDPTGSASDHASKEVLRSVHRSSLWLGVNEEDEDEGCDWLGELGALVAYDTNRLESRGPECKRDRASVCSFCKIWRTPNSTGDGAGSVRVSPPRVCETTEDSSEAMSPSSQR